MTIEVREPVSHGDRPTPHKSAATKQANGDSLPTATDIARGSAGDCCILCGQVGIDLPVDHRCQPNIDIQAYRAQPRLNWEELWTRPKPRVPSPNNVIQLPTAGRLAGLLRTVANAPKGERQTILFWAGSRAAENGYPESAFELLEDAARSTGADNHDIDTGLRMRPSRQRVNA